MATEEPIIVGIDIGTTKTCTLIGRIEGQRSLRILGVGIEPSQGLRKGAVVDMDAVTQTVSRSVEKAERSAGLEITRALVSVAGAQIASINSRGAVGISGGVIRQEDIYRALEAAQAVAIPHNREIIHVIQRGFSVDQQNGIHSPVGMHGYRLEVEAHIITAASSAIENLRQCVEAAGVQVAQFVLNPLATGEAVLTDSERQLGVIVCDIGGGTTDLAIYIDNDVWHTAVLPVGGAHVTSDIAYGLRLPLDQAERIKIQYGHAFEEEVGEDETINVRTFGEGGMNEVPRKYLAQIIEPRVEEIFQLVLDEIKRSGYDGLLPAGIVLSGGSSLLPGTREVATRVLNVPVRIAQPEGLVGLVDQLHSPAFSTSVGLLQWAMLMQEIDSEGPRGSRRPGGTNHSKWTDWLKRLMP
jgi:cell division protein FtsA